MKVSRNQPYGGGGVLGAGVGRRARPASINDVAAEDPPRAWAASRAGLHAKFAFAVTNRRKVTGVIALFSHDRRSLDRAMLREMADIGSQIGQFIERRRAEEELRHSREPIRPILDNVAA